MKIVIVICSLVLLGSTGLTAEKDKPDGSPVVFYTSNCSYGPIQIYVNNQYKGTITKCYSSIPHCADEGSVTVMISGNSNTWHAQTSDGKVKWKSKPVTLSGHNCQPFKLN